MGKFRSDESGYGRDMATKSTTKSTKSTVVEPVAEPAPAVDNPATDPGWVNPGIPVPNEVPATPPVTVDNPAV